MFGYPSWLHFGLAPETPRKLSSLSFGDSRQILIMGRGNEQYFRRKEVLNEELKALHAKVVKGKNFR